MRRRKAVPNVHKADRDQHGSMAAVNQPSASEQRGAARILDGSTEAFQVALLPAVLAPSSTAMPREGSMLAISPLTDRLEPIDRFQSRGGNRSSPGGACPA
jgi:hypothetical protein